jgi:hypothetical protein
VVEERGTYFRLSAGELMAMGGGAALVTLRIMPDRGTTMGKEMRRDCEEKEKTIQNNKSIKNKLGQELRRQLIC